MVISVALAAILLIVVYVIWIYNRLINLQNRANEAFATMDVYLKKRWDLIPNLVEVVKGYAGHEKTTLAEITALRSGVYGDLSPAAKINADKELTGAISRLMVMVESYPALRADQHFLTLQSQLAGAEEDIANARKYYNAVIRNYNNMIQMFPGNLVASIFNFKKRPMFEVIDTERQIREVKLK